jgi:hypothetical protein
MQILDGQGESGYTADRRKKHTDSNREAEE